MAVVVWRGLTLSFFFFNLTLDYLPDSVMVICFFLVWGKITLAKPSERGLLFLSRPLVRWTICLA
jgi:hypothetical protein